MLTCCYAGSTILVTPEPRRGSFLAPPETPKTLCSQHKLWRKLLRLETPALGQSCCYALAGPPSLPESPKAAVSSGVTKEKAWPEPTKSSACRRPPLRTVERSTVRSRSCVSRTSVPRLCVLQSKQRATLNSRTVNLEGATRDVKPLREA